MLTFDDVVMIPQYSEVESRSEVDISTKMLGRVFKLPIISSNMDSVTGPQMPVAMSKNGGFGILHRYFKNHNNVIKLIVAYKKSGVYAVPSVGVQKDDYKLADLYIESGADAICVDIAHGDSKRMVEIIEYLSPKIKVIAGNVATGAGFLRLADAGASAIKIGVGSGAACTTRLVTGHGVPQLTAIEMAYDTKEHHGLNKVAIIADGGIRTSGDIVKALAKGADAVMLGSLLAGTDEAPGQAIEGYKTYRGMASREAQLDFRGKVNNSAPEGVSFKVKYKGPVSGVLENLAGGIRSGCSYSGATTLRQLREYARFRQVTQASYVEGTPHGIAEK